MLKESDILHQNGNFWVRKSAKGLPGYEVYEVVGTHSVRRSIFGSDGPQWLQKAKDRADELANKAKCQP